MGNCVKLQRSDNKKEVSSRRENFLKPSKRRKRRRADDEHGPKGDDDFDSVKARKSKEFSKKKLEKLFEQYKQQNSQTGELVTNTLTHSQNEDTTETTKDYITQEGLAQFCKDLGIDEDDSVLFILAYLFKIEDITLGFSKEEFINGFEKYKLDTIDKIRNYLPDFRKELEDVNSESFRDIHRWGFDFAKTEKEHRVVDKESVIVMLMLIWQNKNYHVTKFVEYLKTLDSETGVKALNLDQWTSLYEFAITTNPELSNFDQNSAWPCIIDDYVAWVQSGTTMPLIQNIETL